MKNIWNHLGRYLIVIISSYCNRYPGFQWFFLRKAQKSVKQHPHPNLISTSSHQRKHYTILHHISHPYHPQPQNKNNDTWLVWWFFSPSHLKNMNSSMLDHHPQVGVKINTKMFENQHRDEKKRKKLLLPGKLTMSPKNQWVVQIVFSHWNSPFLGDEFVSSWGCKIRPQLGDASNVHLIFTSPGPQWIHPVPCNEATGLGGDSMRHEEYAHAPHILRIRDENRK